MFKNYAGVGPDGMTISRDGHLWVAVPGDGSGNGAVVCYCSKTGKEITRVRPFERPPRPFWPFTASTTARNQDTMRKFFQDHSAARSPPFD